MDDRSSLTPRGSPQVPLLPCPFCGSAGSTHENDWADPPMWSVVCCGANCFASVRESLTEAEAIAAWNRRAPGERNSSLAQERSPKAEKQNLVERLREMYASAVSDRPISAGRLCNEAADEIDRLNALLAEATTLVREAYIVEPGEDDFLSPYCSACGSQWADAEIHKPDCIVSAFLQKATAGETRGEADSNRRAPVEQGAGVPSAGQMRQPSAADANTPAIAAYQKAAPSNRADVIEECAKVAEAAMGASARVRDKMAPSAPIAGLEDALHGIVVSTARGIAANIRALASPVAGDEGPSTEPGEAS